MTLTVIVMNWSSKRMRRFRAYRTRSGVRSRPISHIRGLCFAKTFTEMQEDQAILLQKFNELHIAYKDKSKAHANLKKLYDAGKAKEMAINVQDAAEDDADEALLGGVANRFHDRMGTGTGIGGHSSHFPMDRHGVEQIHSRQRSGGSGGMEGDARFASHWPQPGAVRAHSSR